MSAAGLSTARLARMHEVLRGHVERGVLPGLVTIVCRRGETHVDAIGAMAVGGGPMRPDAIFRIASMTKPVAAVAAMILVEECALRLDEPVDRLLPELADRKVLTRLDGPLDETVPAHRPITLRDLLTLRMGFGYIFEPSDAYPIQKAIRALDMSTEPELGRAVGPDEWIRRLGTLPLLHQPGDRFMYDTGMDVLGVLIARAANQPLAAFFAERIFEPLGMRDTGFYVPAEKLDRLADCYHAGGEADPAALVLFDGPEASRWSRPPAFPQASGGLVSTADDYLIFAQMLRNRGRHGRARILSRPSVELMTANHLTAEQQSEASLLLDGRGWGFGMAAATARNNLFITPGRYGWEGGYGTSWATDPGEDLTAILLTQLRFPESLNVYLDFWTSVYQAIDD